MHDTIFWRLVWKEYRTQRWFWVGLVALALVAQLFVLITMDRAEDRTVALFYVAWWLPVFYALGCGAILFAAEQEDDTIQWLRILPTTPGRLLASKIGFSLVSVTAMIGVLQLLAFVFAGENVPAANGAKLAAFAVTTAEFLVWSVFFSLTTRRVLNAVALAALCALMVNCNNSVWLRGIMFASIAGANVWLVRDWLLGRPIGWPFSFGFVWPFHSRAALTDIESKAAPWRRALTRLLWHELRQARPFAGTCFTLGMLLILVSPLSYQWLGIELAYFIIPVTPLVLGVCVFQGEQYGRRYRFLTEQGIASEAVWLSKQLVWLAVLATTMVGFLTVDWLAREFYAWLNTSAGYSSLIWKASIQPDVFTALLPESHVVFASNAFAFAYGLLFVLLSYSAGQLTSILFARSVMAAFVGLILAGLSIVWLASMYLLQVPLFWSVAPIPVIFFLATLVRCGGWMLERNTWRVWLRVGAVLFIPLSIVFAGMAVYRVYEIPVPANRSQWVTPELLEPATTEELRTADMYRRAVALLVSRVPSVQREEDEKTVLDGWQFATEEEREWLKQNQQALRVLLEATARESCVFVDPSHARMNDSSLCIDEYSLQKLLLLSARKLEADGDLDVALDRYLASMRMARHLANRAHDTYQRSQSFRTLQRTYRWLPQWAAQAGQTPQRICSAIRLIANETAKFPSPIEALAAQRAIQRRALIDDIDSLFYLARAQTDPKWLTALFMARYCPWERNRTVRLLDWLTVLELGQIADVERWLRDDTRDLAAYCRESEEAELDSSRPLWLWLRTTPVASQSDHGFWPQQRWLTWNTVYNETSCRAHLLILALLAWQLEHEALPSELDQLADTVQKLSLVDPWSGMAFGYYPHGLPQKLNAGFAKIPAGTPFLWSSGRAGARLVPRMDPTTQSTRYIVTLPDGHGAAKEYGDGSIAYDVGRTFLIPKPHR